MKTIHYNFPDKLFSQFSSMFAEKEYQSAISEAIANYIENVADEKDCKAALERKKKPAKLYSLDEVFGD